MRKIVLLITVWFAALCGSCLGQKNELAVVVGAKITPSVGSATNGTQSSFDTTFAFEGNYAHQLLHVPTLALHLEFPVVATPSANFSTHTAGNVGSYSSLFFTPSLRLRFGPPEVPVAFWISAGGGLAHFNPSTSEGACMAIAGAVCVVGASSTKGAFQGGAGLDFHPGMMPFAFRGRGA